MWPNLAKLWHKWFVTLYFNGNYLPVVYDSFFGGLIMKKTILAAAIAMTAATAASATTFSVDVAAFPYRQTPATSGLQTRAWTLASIGSQNFDGATYTFDLNAGDSVTIDLYRMVAFDAPIDADDLEPRASNASLALVGNATRTVMGYSFARAATQDAIVDFVESVSFNIGGGLRLIATMHDTVFGTNGQGTFTTGGAGAGTVQATFTVAPVPVPASLPLAATGLGLLGFFGRRRKKAQK